MLHPELMNVREVADRTDLSVKSIDRYVKAGTFPQPLRFSRRCVRWRRVDIEAYLTASREPPPDAA